MKIIYSPCSLSSPCIRNNFRSLSSFYIYNFSTTKKPTTNKIETNKKKTQHTNMLHGYITLITVTHVRFHSSLCFISQCYFVKSAFYSSSFFNIYKEQQLCITKLTPNVYFCHSFGFVVIFHFHLDGRPEEFKLVLDDVCFGWRLCVLY